MMSIDAGVLFLSVVFLVLSLPVANGLGENVPQLVPPLGYIPGTSLQYEGILADTYCVNIRKALDGADMLTHPEQHTLHCLVDITRCYQSPYCLLLQNSSTGLWGCGHKWNQTETFTWRNFMLKKRIADGERSNIRLRFNATWDITTVPFQMIPIYSTVQYASSTGTFVLSTIVTIVAILLILIVGGIGGLFHRQGKAMNSTISATFIFLILLLCTVAVFLSRLLDTIDSFHAAPVPRAIGHTIRFLLFFVLLPTTKHFGIGHWVGESYEKFIQYHIVGGMLIWLCATVHMAMMFVEFKSVEPNGKFLFRFKGSRFANGAGFVSYLFLTCMLLTAFLRSKIYGTFRLVHYTFPVMLGFIVWHNPTTGYFLIPPLLLYCIDVVLRLRCLVTRQASVSACSVDKLSEVVHLTVHLPSSENSPVFSPGQHMFLYLPSCSILHFHPFTLAWWDDSQEEAHFFIRGQGPWTATLVSLVLSSQNTSAQPQVLPVDQTNSRLPVEMQTGTETFHEKQRQILGPVRVLGPYGSLPYPLHQVSHLCVIAGGIGVTFLLNLLQAVTTAPLSVERKQGEALSVHLATFVWVVRERSLVELVWPSLVTALRQQSTTTVKLHIYLTSIQGDESFTLSNGTDVLVHHGRPGVKQLIGEFANECGGEVATGKNCVSSAPFKVVYACGPTPLLEVIEASCESHHQLCFDAQAFSFGAGPGGERKEGRELN